MNKSDDIDFVTMVVSSPQMGFHKLAKKAREPDGGSMKFQGKTHCREVSHVVIPGGLEVDKMMERPVTMWHSHLEFRAP